MPATEVKLNRYKSNTGINLMHIKTDKFKTNSINIFVHNQLDRKTAAENALLPMVLKRGSSDYPTMQELSKQLEILYGSTFDCGVVKKGERQIIHFYIDSVGDKYLKTGENVFKACTGMLNSIISNPLIQDGSFNDEYVRQEKENLAKLIQSRINDKDQYAVERCYELMCEGERYSIHEWGSIDDLGRISGKSLVDRYQDAFKTSRIDLAILGDVNEEWVDRLITMMNLSTDNSRLADTEVSSGETAVKTVVEEMDVTQGKLTMGFRTNTAPTDLDYYALVVYSSVLGGGPHSKLFINVRERASLAYYVTARLEKFKGLMMVRSGIEAENYDKAREIILKQVDEIREGKVSDQEFETSINTLVNGIRALYDEPLQMVDFFLVETMLGTNNDFESIINKIKAVKPEDVVKAAKKVELDTVYFMKPKG